MHVKISSANWRPFCPGSDELMPWRHRCTYSISSTPNFRERGIVPPCVWYGVITGAWPFIFAFLLKRQGTNNQLAKSTFASVSPNYSSEYASNQKKKWQMILFGKMIQIYILISLSACLWCICVDTCCDTYHIQPFHCSSGLFSAKFK